MSEENPNPQPDLTSQFRELGENIKDIFQSAWESEESQRFRDELRSGFDEFGKATNQAVEEFQASETGQKFKAEAEDFKTRVETGEVEQKARDEISKVLDFINSELSGLSEQIKPKDAPADSAAPPAPEASAEDAPGE